MSTPGVQRTAFFIAGLGLVGWGGIGMLALAAAAVLVAVPALERGDADAARELAGVDRQLVRLHDPAGARALRDPLGTWIASLPQESAVPDFVAAVQRRAERASVGIDRTEYRVQSELGHAVQRYRLSFPAHVDYPHLRTWLEALLHDYPNLTLDEISLRREVDGGEELEAQVSMSFLTREGK
jgi:D-arabinose 1-dehydrogenase-like Zn-dependent alcohol dehydrogenase